MENEDHINEQVKRLLEGLEVQPDLRSFGAVVQKLEKKKKRRFIIFLWSGVALVLGLLAALVWLPAVGKLPETAVVKRSAPAASTNTLPAVEKEKSLPGKIIHPAAPSLAAPPASSSTALAETTKEKKADPNKTEQLAPSTIYNKSYSPGELKNKTWVKASKEKEQKQDQENNGLAVQPTSTNPAPANAPASFSRPGIVEIQPGAKALILQKDTEAFLYLPPLTVVFADSLALRPAPAVSVLNFREEKKAPENWELLFWTRFSPQLGSFRVSGNPANPVYTSSFSNLSGFYQQSKANQNVLSLQYAIGLKEMLVINHKYELAFGLGFQQFKNWTAAHTTATGKVDPTIPPSFVLYDEADPRPYDKAYRYSYFSVEGNRIFKWNKTFKWKLGAGLQINHLRSGKTLQFFPLDFTQHRQFEQMNTWVYTIHAQAGLIADLNRRMRLQLCPGIFAAPNSIFPKNYIIRQKPYGFQLEALLLFKLF